jgi:hypothetical protein
VEKGGPLVRPDDEEVQDEEEGLGHVEMTVRLDQMEQRAERELEEDQGYRSEESSKKEKIDR